MINPSILGIAFQDRFLRLLRYSILSSAQTADMGVDVSINQNSSLLVFECRIWRRFAYGTVPSRAESI